MSPVLLLTENLGVRWGFLIPIMFTLIRQLFVEGGFCGVDSK